MPFFISLGCPYVQAPAKPEAKSPKPAAKPAPAKPAAAKTPPAAKKATEAKRASGKRSSSKKGKEPAKEEVRKVERIVDVRVTKVGNVEFLIKWSGLGDKENSWEPEDHILDDSLIDEYMKARLVKMAPPGGKYAPGSSVDVLGEADGFEYSWAPAKVSCGGVCAGGGREMGWLGGRPARSGVA